MGQRRAPHAAIESFMIATRYRSHPKLQSPRELINVLALSAVFLSCNSRTKFILVNDIPWRDIIVDKAGGVVISFGTLVVLIAALPVLASHHFRLACRN
jgi:hypothetical protein